MIVAFLEGTELLATCYPLLESAYAFDWQLAIFALFLALPLASNLNNFLPHCVALLLNYLENFQNKIHS